MALERSPPLYPDAITRTPDATSDAAARAVVPGHGCSVKDSFATLDLQCDGFAVLFEASWIYHPPDDAGPAVRSGWTVVESEIGLDEWARATGDAVDVPGAALRHPDVRVLRAPRHGAGAIASRSGSVVGVSNLFAHDDSRPAPWAEIAAVVRTMFPGLAIVGYEHGDRLEAALQAGFDAIGPLRVWLAH
jgi:hypothetical protein